MLMFLSYYFLLALNVKQEFPASLEFCHLNSIKTTCCEQIIQLAFSGLLLFVIFSQNHSCELLMA